MQLVLQVLSIERTGSPQDATATEFVATIPRGAVPDVRPTAIVIREMIENARENLVVLGYLVTSDGGALPLLQRAATRGVDISVVCDRECHSAEEIRRCWGIGLPSPKLWVNAEDDTAMPFTKMHCKLILADSCDLLITSANFTFHGMQGNIEFGTRIRGEPAMAAGRFFAALKAQELIVPAP